MLTPQNWPFWEAYPCEQTGSFTLPLQCPSWSLGRSLPNPGPVKHGWHVETRDTSSQRFAKVWYLLDIPQKTTRNGTGLLRLLTSFTANIGEIFNYRIRVWCMVYFQLSHPLPEKITNIKLYIYIAYHRLIMFQICVSVSCRLGSALQNREIGESPLKWKYVSRNLEA